MNPFKYWLIIKDDSKRTFEVCGQTSNTNAFTNQVYAMQRSGMNISGVTPPITAKNSSKDLNTIANYTKENGLYERLQKQHLDITLKSAHLDDDMPE